MKRIILTLAVIGAVTLAMAEPEIRGTASELSAHLAAVPQTVALSGEGEVKVAADRAVVSLLVVTENRALQEASRANQELRGRIIKVLTAQGISADRIVAAKFSSTPKYGVFGDKAKSYRVENVVKATVLDEKEFQFVGQVVDANAEVRYESIILQHSDQTSLQQQATLQALEKVIAKQKLYESKLGVRLSVRSFQEARNGDIAPDTRRRMSGGIEAKSSPLPTMRAGSFVSQPDGMEPEFSASFGELVFKAELTVEFSVNPR